MQAGYFWHIADLTTKLSLSTFIMSASSLRTGGKFSQLAAVSQIASVKHGATSSHMQILAWQGSTEVVGKVEGHVNKYQYARMLS